MKHKILVLICASLVASASSQADCSGYNPAMCEDMEGGTFLPSQTSCQNWVQCDEFGGIHDCGVCPGGLYFHPNDQTCTYPALVDCETPEGIRCEPEYTGRLPHPESCTIYFQCLGDGNSVEAQCAPNLHFDEAIGACNFPEIANCDREPYDFQCPEEDEGPFSTHPHPRDCTRYFMCIGGVATELECPSGLHFDSVLGQCNLPEVAGCEDPNPTEEPTEPVDPEPEDFLKRFIGEVYVCPEEVKFSLTPYEGDRQIYIQCIDGVKDIKRCAKNLIFNPKSLRCDYPERANHPILRFLPENEPRLA